MNRSTLRRACSRESLSRDVRTAAIALLISVLVLATPSVAAKIKNADKVDGKDAVSAGASIAKRKGNLVATNSQGRLPDNIIKKALDANRLDGLDGAAYATKTAKRGEVLRGDWGAWGGGANSYVEDTVSFGRTLPVAIPSTRFTVLGSGAPATAECPGEGQVVPRGWLCVYTTTTIAVTGLNGYNPTDGGDDTSLYGFGVWGDCPAAQCVQYGSWALRVGTRADLGPRPAARGVANPR